MSDDLFDGRRRCSNCGAVAADGAGGVPADDAPKLGFCEYCGEKLGSRAPVEAGGRAQLEERFQHVQESPRYADLMAHIPAAGSGSRFNFETLMIVVFATCVTGVMALGFATTCAPLGILPIAFLAFLLVQVFKKPKDDHTGAPLERKLVRVVATRAQITPGDGAQGQSQLYVTLESVSGEASEHPALAELSRHLREDTIGVAYLRGSTVIDLQPGDERPEPEPQK